jgi:DNA sulfur modification protein DndE
MSYRSQNLLGQLKVRTGLTPNITGRFALCLSLKDPSVPNPDEFDEKGSEIHPQVLFGDYENIFLALFIQRLKDDGLDPELYLNRMLRAHFNRGTIALYSRVKDLADFNSMVKNERLS